jgi:predicted glycoside hydrolase/deacetylase ChbG (UPF0249 family)
MDIETLYDIEKAVDYAFYENKFTMNTFSYLKLKNLRRIDAYAILRSTTIKHIQETIKDLDIYLKGGQEESAVYVRQAYGYLSKPDARKVRNYLDEIVEGIKKFIKDKNAKNKNKNAAPRKTSTTKTK